MTIIEEPALIVSAYEEQIVRVIDPAATDTGYVVCTVEYHNGDGHWRDLTPQSQRKYRNTNEFRFDISDVLKQVVTHDFPTESSSIVVIGQMNSISLCRIKLEHFELSAGVYTSQSTTTGSSFKACNTIADTIADYYLDDGSTEEFLTTMKEQVIRENDIVQLAFLQQFGEVSSVAKIVNYPLSGGSATNDISFDTPDNEFAGFYGIDTNPLTASVSLSESNAVIAYTTDSSGKEYIGINFAATGYITFANTDVGLKLRIHCHALAVGSSIKVTYNGAASNETLTVAVGWNTVTGGAIPAATTSIKIENLTGDVVMMAYANILTENASNILSERGVVVINAYDATDEKIEIYMYNDSAAISEVITYYMNTVCGGLRLAWLSSLGNMEHYTFTDNENTRLKADKKRILSGKGSATERGIRTTDSRSNETTTIFTFFENADKFAWLSEIIESPEVYLVDSSNGRTLIDVVSADFPLVSPSLEQGSLTFRLSKFKGVQRG
jgi:hypothetical protein